MTECIVCGFPGLRPEGHAEWCERVGAYNRSLGPVSNGVQCSGCGCPVDERRIGCETCRKRHQSRRRQRQLAAATGTAAKAAPEGIGERPAPEAVAVPVGVAGCSSFSSASSAESGDSTPSTTNGAACDSAVVNTTTA